MAGLNLSEIGFEVSVFSIWYSGSGSRFQEFGSLNSEYRHINPLAFNIYVSQNIRWFFAKPYGYLLEWIRNGAVHQTQGTP